MTHDVSLTYSRFEHMPPSALALATLLHGLVALALFWISPLRPIEHFEDAIEITMEAPVPPTPQAAEQPSPPPPPPPAPSQPAAAAQPSGPPMRLGLPPPSPNTDQRGTPGVETPSRQATDIPTPDKTQQDGSKQETEQKEAQEPPAQQQALAQPAPPPPPPSPSLEQALPPVDLPPPPVTERDVPKPAPTARPAPPQQAQRPAPPPPQQHPQPQRPPPQQQGLRPSPLGQAPQPRAPTERQAAVQPPSATFHNPADNYGQRRAEEQYLWQVMRRIAQFPYVPKNTSTIREEGTVLTRVTIARDGRLLGVVLERSSGLASLDTGVLETIRRASPYPPLPADIPGDRHSFLLPVSFRYNQAR